jgi:tRNA-splicing ligase RtcB (3'-phosphate/5'-hydroxy nucleic acid ligase)
VTATMPAKALEHAAATLRVFDTAAAPADAFALSTLLGGAVDADLAAPAVVLPDFHLKDDKEMPSSIAVATRDTIRPTFTCSSLNCGMALVALDVERPGAEAIVDFYRRVRERLPYPPTYRRVLTTDEVVRCAVEGAHFAVDKFGFDPAATKRMEHGGRIDADSYGGAERIRRELPWSVKQLSRIRFATIGKSNHFIELQEVEEIYDEEAAALLGVEAGQVTLQYHGGGGSLPTEVGVLFGRRKRFPRSLRIQMSAQKPLYHLASARSLDEFKLRRRLYFSGSCPPVGRASREGERLMLSNVMAMNYGFAFRLSAYAILMQLAEESGGTLAPRLVVDSPHNSVYEEEIDGVTAVVHRHNAARAYPASRLQAHPVFGRIGQPLLLPGTNRTSSLLCVAGDGAHRSLYTAPHGAGSTIKSFAERGLSEADPERRVTRRFDYAGNARDVPQLDDKAIDDTLAVLMSHDIVRPVARLRPFAVLN